MSDVIRNRYDFVVLFDVETATPTATPMPATCPAPTRKRVWGW